MAVRARPRTFLGPPTRLLTPSPTRRFSNPLTIDGAYMTESDKSSYIRDAIVFSNSFFRMLHDACGNDPDKIWFMLQRSERKMFTDLIPEMNERRKASGGKKKWTKSELMFLEKSIEQRIAKMLFPPKFPGSVKQDVLPGS